ncbi:protein kinase C-binding protein NELL2a-like isoform X2 [Tachypleus tridentatus]|uniref:protein kinase C-binding protein NELL2a-like isoform X2 n=1 Tax=Tachypleus tridentatus TaxID=6853 RepID=UPI003FCF5090
MKVGFINLSSSISWLRCRSTMLAFLYALITSELVAYKLACLQIESKYQVDLIEGLRVFNTTYRGVTVAEGFNKLSPAIRLSGDSRQLVLPVEVYSKAANLLYYSNEFTFALTLRQEERNTGTILSFSEGNNRFLEVQTSGRKNEVRFHYTCKDMLYVETFPYRLADNTWHQLALSVSGNNIEIYVDCSKIYTRVLKEIEHNFTGRNVSLWLGQRTPRHFLFKGFLQDVKIIGRSHGYIQQCPQLNTGCPTCGQFQKLKLSMIHLENRLRELTDRLVEAEKRLTVVEECECRKSCQINGSIHPDGASWKQACDICSCLGGEVKCHPVHCAPVNCKNPFQAPGECCPTCLKRCLLHGVLFDHGEEVSPRDCVKCECKNGNMACNKIDPEVLCPQLTCPVEEQFSVPGECCRFCPGTDFCAKEYDCHANASCINLPTRYTCHCNTGFHGDGKHCKDVDECQKEGDHNGHHCHKNTRCINVPGSYICECVLGYRRVDAFSCAEHDECATHNHECDLNAMCINTEGSYKCECLEGYQGDGYSCKPFCNHTCLNGGQCVAPDVCSCRQGFTGPSCEIDVDECSLGLHQCYPNSQCINMPGWYYCDCILGYQSYLVDNSLGIMCQDTDECLQDSHTCHSTAVCINEDGGFRCECDDNNTCSLGCIYHGTERANGDTWFVESDICSQCTCTNGVVSCNKFECDCNRPDVDLNCCPECDQTSYCHHQEVTRKFRNGEQWIYQCQICECLYGEVDCWPVDCPPVMCDHPVQQPGDCCHQCDDDPCNSQTFSSEEISGNDTSVIQAGRGCFYKGLMYRYGEQVPVGEDPCTSCSCKNGKLCCTYTPSCSDNTVQSTLLNYKDLHNNFEQKTDPISKMEVLHNNGKLDLQIYKYKEESSEQSTPSSSDNSTVGKRVAVVVEHLTESTIKNLATHDKEDNRKIFQWSSVENGKTLGISVPATESSSTTADES